MAHIRIVSLLLWICGIKAQDDSNYIMLVGGYNKHIPNGLLRDVELIASGKTPGCSSFIPPLPGHGDLASTLGMTGQTVGDSVIVCGGKTVEDNQNKCFMYDPKTNSWKENIPEMKHRRFLASSTVDKHGNFWVLGGVDGSDSAKETGIFNRHTKGWERGPDLPLELRLSGIDSHCTVRLNETHLFMTGGFASAYSLPNPISGGSLHAGGTYVQEAWIYDGEKWTAEAIMSTTRDRPACSKLTLEDGSVQVIVAGGCEKWCVHNPSLSSVEIFDLKTRQWKRAADMPVALNSATMELFEGFPTIFGGYDPHNRVRQWGRMTKSENGILYQYFATIDQWIAHPTIQLRIPRSSPAAISVPNTWFPQC